MNNTKYLKYPNIYLLTYHYPMAEAAIEPIIEPIIEPTIEPNTVKKIRSFTKKFYNQNGTLTIFDCPGNYKFHVKFLFNFKDIHSKPSGIYHATSLVGENFQITFNSITDEIDNDNEHHVNMQQFGKIFYFIIMNLFTSCIPTHVKSNRLWMFCKDYKQITINHNNYNGTQCQKCWLCYLRMYHPEIRMINSNGQSDDILPIRIIELLSFMFLF